MQDGSQTTTSESLLPRTEILAAACTEGVRAIKLPPRLPLSKWADEHFYLSEESSATSGPWQTLPLQRAIMDCMGSVAVRIVDVWKCARIGYTKMLMAKMAYNMTHLKRSTGIYQPTEGDANEFSEGEIAPLVRDVEALRGALDADPDKTTKRNKLDYKKFKGANLYIRGGHTPRNYRRLTLDDVIYDELEGFERDVGGEGSPVKLGDKRIQNSPFPKSTRGSTPRDAHDSLIAAEAEKARHLFRYEVPCPHCGELQVLRWSQFVWDKDGTPDERADSARYRCAHCEGEFGYEHLTEICATENGARWATEDGHWIECTDSDPVLRDADDRAVDWPRHIAFHVWAAYSPFSTWSDMVYEWIDAQGDYEALKAFTNTVLAELWEEAGEQVDHSTLYQRREQYLQPPSSVLAITAAVDVQDNRLEVEVVGWSYHEESWGIEYRVLYGDPEMPEVWADLDKVLAQRFETEDGRVLPIAAVGVDTGYLADHVYLWSARSPHPRVYCLKGAKDVNAPLVSAPSRQRIGRTRIAVDLFSVGVGVAKSITYKRLAIADPGPGYCHFPPSYDEEYFRGLTAEKKITKKRRGYEVVEWVKERPRNEPLDIRAYNLAAVAILKPVWTSLDPKFDQRTKVDETGPAETDIEKQFKRERQQRRTRKRRKGFVNRR